MEAPAPAAQCPRPTDAQADAHVVSARHEWSAANDRPVGLRSDSPMFAGTSSTVLSRNIARTAAATSIRWAVPSLY